MAERILSGEAAPPTPSQPPREERGVFGNDTRTHKTPATTYPRRTWAFTENACTGTKIGARTMATAAHCVFDTFDNNDWRCDTGHSDWGGSCSGRSRPRWRFGVEGTTGYTPWTSANCAVPTIATAFVNLDEPVTWEQWWELARWDYCVVDLSGCTQYNTGWLGTLPTTDQQLLDASANNVGYPARALCPADSKGEIGRTTNGKNIIETSCPGTGDWPGSTWRYSNDQPPYTGAQLWGMVSGNVAHGSYYASRTIGSQNDMTDGMSGASLYITLPGSDRRVIGITSVASSPVNMYNRWTTEVYNFFATYSDYPDDTE